MTTQTDDDIDISAGLVPRAPRHPAGKVTAFDEETGLPIVRRAHGAAPAKPPAHVVEKTTVVEAKALPKHAETGRDILHGSNDRQALVKAAKEHAPKLEDVLNQVASAIPGAEMDGVRDEKDPARLSEKIERENQPIETIPDILAGRLKVDSPEAHQAAAAAVHGALPVIRDDDKFDKGDDMTGYRVHRMQVQMSPDLSAEVHIVPKEIADVNDKQHHAYEKMRDAAADAKETNDAAMEKFEARNDGEPASPQSHPTPKGGNGDKPDDKSGNPEQVAGNSGSPLTKGQRVKLPDGKGATVTYVPTKSAQLPVYRFKTDDGKNVEMRAKQALREVKPDHSWTGVDLDGTMAEYHGFKGPEHIGKPIPKMVDRVKRMLANGHDVRIFTARVDDDKDGKARKAIEAWSQKHLGQVLPITNRKDEHMGSFFDDRAVQVERNNGDILGSHRKARSTT